MPVFDFSARSDEAEIMDDLSFKDAVVLQTLRELDTINRWLGGNDVTFCGLDILRRKFLKPGDRISVADLGCGSGTMLKLIVDWGRKHNIEIEAVGVDANPFITEFAIQECREYPEISFLTEDVFSSSFSARSFDIGICTLFLHHFSGPQISALMRQLTAQCQIGLVINDLHRHWLAYHSISLLTGLFSRSYMVRNDARLSVARAFRREELNDLFEDCGFASVYVRWKWAFRYLVVGEKTDTAGR